MHIKLVLTDKRVRSLKPVAKGERVYAQDKILPDLKVCGSKSVAGGNSNSQAGS